MTRGVLNIASGIVRPVKAFPQCGYKLRVKLMRTATKERREAHIAPHTLQSAMIECEVLAVVEKTGGATTEEIKRALPHRSSGKVSAAIKRQSGYCLQSVRDGRKAYWCLA